MSLSLLGPLLIVAGALVLIGLERLYPYDRRQKLLRPGLIEDLIFYGLLQSYLLGLLIAALIEALDRSTGWSRLQLVSGWPLWVQLGFFFVTHDLYIYAFHRLQHRSALLWRIHEAHHATDDVDWISGARSHPLEILINQTIEFAPIVLLGGAPEVAIAKGVLDALWGMYIHSNIDVRSGPLQYVINGPEMHRWHHAREIIDVNFATKLAIWDWLFGTAHHPDHKPRGYGLHQAAFPTGYFRQVLHAFLPVAMRSGRSEPAAQMSEAEEPHRPPREQHG
jgi:sterol desaturase/sphingolipid hydroxylase (fatty acid hydroxylase superfamily)